MAFSLTGGNQNPFSSPSALSGANLQVSTGPDLEEIQTEALGFLALGGEAKVQLLPSPWPIDNLPPPTASLMSIASQRGLLAAAGPDVVVVASTDSVRKVFYEPKSDDSEVRYFRPQLVLSMPTRISQVAFTADENYLVLSAELGGGLAVYEVQNLLNGSTETAFEMPTNSLSLRALVPNPAPEKGELLALVTMDGKLMMANLKERNFVSGTSGQVLKDSVSCVSWSTKGKQLIAGLGDGSCVQMTPDGDVKGQIPRLPNIGSDYHVSSITWLENNVFLVANTPSNFDRGSATLFHVITRKPPSEFVFQKLEDPAGPFGLERYPPHHFLLRLKDFPPNLQDLIIVASSASTDIGLFSRSKVALVANKPSDRVTGVFTRTELYDARRAQMSMTDDNLETSPIGLGLDLSSKEKVIRPIPSDELDESATPVPALMVLNNNGIIASWWVIYSDSIKQGTAYPGLAAASGGEHLTQLAHQQALSFVGSAPNTLSNSINSGTGLSSSTQVTSFGSPSALGTNASAVFGSTSGLNRTHSLWAQPSNSISNSGVTFSKPSLGSTNTSSSQNLAFGTAALPGSRTSPWSTVTVKSSSATFSQPTVLGMTGNLSYGNTSGVGLFGSGSTVGTIPSSGGFASFANKGGFAAAAAQSNGANIFGSNPSPTTFGAPVSSPGKEPSSTVFSNSNLKSENPNGLMDSGIFKLGSTFKPDRSIGNDMSKPIDGGNLLFGGGFDDALADDQKTSTPVINEADMDADDLELESEPEPRQKPVAKVDLDTKQPTPTGQGFSSSTALESTSTASRFQLPAATLQVEGDSFGTVISSVSSAAAAGAKSQESTFSFESLDAVPDMRQDSNPVEESSSIADTAGIESPKIKEEPRSDEEYETNIDQASEAPLPPEPTSKASYFVGESSTSSIEPDAPLPPDFLPAVGPEKAKNLTLLAPDKKNTLPDEVTVGDGLEGEHVPDLNSEEDGQNSQGSEEGSGEDVAEDISPISELQQTSGYTPQSSYGGMTTQVHTENFFTKIPSRLEHIGTKALFGEIEKSNMSIFSSADQFLSPRSPSPAKNSIPSRLRHSNSRSSSAPNIASMILGKPTISSHSPIASLAPITSLKQRETEELRKAEAKRKEAEETQALIDREDILIQSFLEKEVVGSKTLDDFIAHQDYVTHADMDKDSIPAQVEAVYCDINSMIDTLGINSRSLKSFIKGHTELLKASRRTMQDLEDGEEWCLVEIGSLHQITTEDLMEKLDECLIKDMPSKSEACADLEKEMVKVRAKYEDIKMHLANYSNQDNLALARSQPLSAEQTAQQYDLRKNLAKFQMLLTEAEESLTLLRVKLASSRNANSSATGGPTVEAVLKTITKMTSMAEKRSGDIDVLENQMRRLRMCSVTSNGSQEDSPFTTPASKTSIRLSATSDAYNAFHNPNSAREISHDFHAPFVSSTHSNNRETPPKRRVAAFSKEDKQRLKSSMIRKTNVANRVRNALTKNGVRVQSVDCE